MDPEGANEYKIDWKSGTLNFAPCRKASKCDADMNYLVNAITQWGSPQNPRDGVWDPGTERITIRKYALDYLGSEEIVINHSRSHGGWRGSAIAGNGAFGWLTRQLWVTRRWIRRELLRSWCNRKGFPVNPEVYACGQHDEKVECPQHHKLQQRMRVFHRRFFKEGNQVDWSSSAIRLLPGIIKVSPH